MTTKTNEAVSRSAIESYLEDDEDFRRDYSGRGMYSATCFGIVTDNVAKTMMLMAAGILDGDAGKDGDPMDLVLDLANAATVDSMGFQRIVYFPGYELDD